ncbi:MAG: hypothetical protein RIR96_1256, partial [Bacteroidota bacterium]
MNQIVYFQNTPVVFKVGIGSMEKKHFFAESAFSLQKLQKLVTAHPKGFELIFSNVDECRQFIQQHFKQIEAAGGIVTVPDGKMLFIFRRGKWDLPKGKKEEDEDEESCARREIEEETGVGNLQLIKKLTETYHVYIENETTILKTSHWYLYKIDEYQQAVPQT